MLHFVVEVSAVIVYDFGPLSRTPAFRLAAVNGFLLSAPLVSVEPCG
jgi:hypothetical protein